jgi:sigma-B regulation protein RsbU (phosphoserine phosphatase)
VRQAYPSRQVHVEGEGETSGEWDSDRMAQVLTNLLSNAIHYSPEGTPVRLRVWAEGEHVALSVHNLGPPIPGELRPRLFQPLQRGEHPDASRRSIGLGLFIVKHVVKAHGGSVEVASSEEEGTTFSVHLPRKPSDSH